MNLTVRSLLLCSATVLCGTALLAQTPSILEPKVERHQGPPLWISAKSVADTKKIIDLDRIGGDFLRSYVEKQRQSLGDRISVEKSKDGKPLISNIPLSECKSRLGSSDHRGGEAPSATLADLANHSKMILRGTVRAVEPGFSFGDPSSLLSVEISEVTKGIAPKSPVYIDYPVAHFRIGPFTFCNLNTGYEPRPGDEILLFDYTGAVDRDEALYVPRLDQIFFFQSQSGSLFLPPHLKNTPDLKTVRTLDDILGSIRSMSSLEGGLEGGAQ